VTNATRNVTAAGKSRTHGGVEKQQRKIHQADVEPSSNNHVTVQQPFYAQPRAQLSIAEEHEPMAVCRPSMTGATNSYQYTGQIDNIDERDTDDPLCATEYVHDMYSLFREKEPTTSVRPVFMESQPHINERMRSILVDWLVEVHLKFKLVPETLYLTVNLIDRYLERDEVSRPKLQLVGVTSLLIASKYEEIYPPELRDLVYICDRAYTRNDVSC